MDDIIFAWNYDQAQRAYTVQVLDGYAQVWRERSGWSAHLRCTHASAIHHNFPALPLALRWVEAQLSVYLQMLPPALQEASALLLLPDTAEDDRACDLLSTGGILALNPSMMEMQTRM